MIGGYIGTPVGGVVNTAQGGVLTQTLADLSLSATGQVALKAAASITLASVSISATGALALKAQAAITLADVSLSSQAALLIRGALTATLSDLLANSSSAIAIAGELNQTLEDLSLLAAGAALGSITDTEVLQKPVDFALAGEQLIKDRYREYEIPAYKRTETVRVKTGGARMLSKQKSSFTTRTGSRGYD